MTINPLRVLWRGGVVGLFLLVGMMVVGAFAPATYAHADVDRSSPAVDSVIPASPATVEVWFTQELFRREDANRLEVTASDGRRVDLEDSRIDDDDRTHLIVSLQPDLPAGLYTVRWINTSLEDGHAEEGEFVFTIDPNASAESAPAAESTVVPTVMADPTLPPRASMTPALPTPTIGVVAGSSTDCALGFMLLPLLLGSIGVVGWTRKGRRP